MKLSVIIVSYNTRALTLACIASVYRETGSDCEIIVVDNASTDGSARAIHGVFPSYRYPDLRLYELEQNIGFAAANNLAATEARGDYLLLLNPDTVVLDRALDRLVRFADGHPEYGIYGGSTLSADGSLNPAAGRIKPSLWGMFCVALGLAKLFPRTRLFNPESLAWWSWDEPRKVDIVAGCLLMIRKEEWQRLGGLDARYFTHGEDADLCLRAARVGLQPVLVPEARIVHHGGASERLRSDKLIQLFRARVQLLREHYLPVIATAGIFLLLLHNIVRVAGFGLASTISEAAENRRDEWLNIWSRRHDWVQTVSAMRGVATAAAGDPWRKPLDH